MVDASFFISNVKWKMDTQVKRELTVQFLRDDSPISDEEGQEINSRVLSLARLLRVSGF